MVAQQTVANVCYAPFCHHPGAAHLMAVVMKVSADQNVGSPVPIPGPQVAVGSRPVESTAGLRAFQLKAFGVRSGDHILDGSSRLATIRRACVISVGAALTS